ncbi:MAG: 5'-methylthioadenosine/S-adenosylhomocysteine nucleosidase [Erysipelotrichaceae bacterium]|nr:5'-methylthioadenosine/S-adenosylhomocysteine nucleosidase [Erysipelotrichaceae bacterium]
MKFLIIVAMDSERDGFLNKLDFQNEVIVGTLIHHAVFDDKDIYLAKCDVGKVNAAILTTLLIKYIKPSYVINAGIGGGLNPSVNIYDVIASSKVAYHDFDLTPFGFKKGAMDNNKIYFNGSRKLLSLLPNEVRKGLIVSGDQFISKKEKLEEILNDFKKALVCDMEGAAIAHATTKLARKFLVIRCVTDNPFLKTTIDEYYDHKVKAIDKVATITLDLIKNYK